MGLKWINHGLARDHRFIENTFGILVACWRILLRSIDATPERVEKIVLACVAFQNYLRQTDIA